MAAARGLRGGIGMDGLQRVDGRSLHAACAASGVNRALLEEAADYLGRSASVVIIIGASGIVLLTLGILAVLMRERITTFVERFNEWNA